jgi:hypothetical protein
MTSEQFVYWLKGYLEGYCREEHGDDPYEPLDKIQEKLKEVSQFQTQTVSHWPHNGGSMTLGNTIKCKDGSVY